MLILTASNGVGSGLHSQNSPQSFDSHPVSGGVRYRIKHTKILSIILQQQYKNNEQILSGIIQNYEQKK